MAKSEEIKLEMTLDVDVSWHLEGDEIVFDTCSIPMDRETFASMWPDWMLGAPK